MLEFAGGSREHRLGPYRMAHPGKGADGKDRKNDTGCHLTGHWEVSIESDTVLA